jgi:hypothetical protein
MMACGMHGGNVCVTETADASGCPVNPFEAPVQFCEDDLRRRLSAGKVFRTASFSS